MGEAMLSMEEFAERIGVKPKTVATWKRRFPDVLPEGEKVGRDLYRFPESAVDAWKTRIRRVNFPSGLATFLKTAYAKEQERINAQRQEDLLRAAVREELRQEALQGAARPEGTAVETAEEHVEAAKAARKGSREGYEGVPGIWKVPLDQRPRYADLHRSGEWIRSEGVCVMFGLEPSSALPAAVHFSPDDVQVFGYGNKLKVWLYRKAAALAWKAKLSPPEGYKSVPEAAKLLGVETHLIRTAIVSKTRKFTSVVNIGRRQYVKMDDLRTYKEHYWKGLLPATVTEKPAVQLALMAVPDPATLPAPVPMPASRATKAAAVATSGALVIPPQFPVAGKETPLAPSMPTGWICPIHNRTLAPHVIECPYCVADQAAAGRRE